MKLQILATAAALAAFVSGAAGATEYDADEDHGHRAAVAYRLILAAPADPGVQAAMRRDLKYADEMIEHHRGAVRMSEAYLRDAEGNNPFLRRMSNAIIENQQFEIAWLDDLRRRVLAAPEPLDGLGRFGISVVPAGVAGMEHRVRFNKAPITNLSDLVRGAGEPASAFDVMFAKAMIVHHSMALDMARDYDGDPDGGNAVIREINFGILRDQAVEIAMLEGVVSTFPGDPDSVPIEQEMHDMMGMPHASH